MITETKRQYTATIGIECHVQLKTTTKLFSAVSNDDRNAEPNTLISHICLGMPGALPVLNKEAINLAIKASLALGVKPQKFSKFDRKHYFYPDLPKGYQITQYDQPVIVGGFVDIHVGDEPKRINLTRAHLEEDAGKSTHPAGADFSLVDLNRAGTPLLEIVSEPEMHTAEEAKAYVRELYLLMRYAGVSEADLFHGNMRFDVNVSVSKNLKRMGTRTETKNLNSFRSVADAVEYEIERQIEVLEKSGSITQETRGWDESKQKTVLQRTKEDAHDYRYFPEPDIPPIEIDDKMVEKTEKAMPVMPAEWRQRLAKLGLDARQTDSLLLSELDDGSGTYLPLIEKNMNNPEKAKTLANWFINSEIPLRRESEIDKNIDNKWREKLYQELHELVSANKLSSTSVKSLLTELLKTGQKPDSLEKYASEKGYIQVSDIGEIEKIIKQVLSENPEAANDVKKGESKAIGFLVGQVMKASRGQANPQLAQELIKKKLQ